MSGALRRVVFGIACIYRPMNLDLAARKGFDGLNATYAKKHI